MKLYNLSWSWHEDYCPHNFLHKEDKTQEQFESDVKSLCIKYGDEYINKDTGHWLGACDLLEFIVTKLPELGYEQFETVNVNAFGAFIIEDEGGEDKEFADKFLNEELFNKIIAANNKIRKEMEDSYDATGHCRS